MSKDAETVIVNMFYIQKSRGKHDHYEGRNRRYWKDPNGTFRDEKHNVCKKNVLDGINNKYHAAEENITELEE